MIRAYLRCSTAQQDTEQQRFEILKFCDERKWQVDEWCIETISGTKKYTERELGVLLSKCEKDSTLICTEMSRLGRSLLDVMTILNVCMEKGIKVYTTKEKFELADTTSSKILAFTFSLAADIERQMISQRTKEALAKKKAEGIPLGRKKGSLSKSKLDGQENMIRELLGKKVSKASIAKIVGPCHPGTLDSFIKTRGLVPLSKPAAGKEVEGNAKNKYQS